MPIIYRDNKGNQIAPPRDNRYDKGVRISEYKEATGHTWKSGVWMKWWNWNKDRAEIIKAKREHDKTYYNRHRDNILKKRRDAYNSSV